MISGLVRPSSVRRSTSTRVRASVPMRVNTIRHSAWFACRFLARPSRCRRCLPDDASTGATPQRCAHAASLRIRSGLSPAEKITHAEVPPGLIAYLAGDPAGWTRIGPRAGFPRVGGSKSLARVLTDDDAGVWWVTCFAVDSRHRRSGVGLALLKAAVEFAREHGATAVEGYPADATALKAVRVSGYALYTGTVAMFVVAGFAEVARPSATRPVMRLVK